MEDRLPSIRDEREIDFCVVNGENAANGAGITARIARRLLDVGADVVTTGNHAFRQKDSSSLYDELDNVLRPANVSAPGVPGRGTTTVTAACGVDVAVINLQGSLFMTTPTSPFLVVDTLIEEARATTPVVLVDFHAEATSEKMALAQYLEEEGVEHHAYWVANMISARGDAALIERISGEKRLVGEWRSTMSMLPL